MMGKKISVNKLESVANHNIISVPLHGAEEVEITIKKSISLKEVLQFVEDVVSTCVDAETGAYMPETLPFLIKAHVLTSYANFNLPANAEKQYDLIYNTTAVSQVMEHINQEQYHEIVDAIYSKIQHNLAVMESSLAEQMNDLLARMSAFTENSEKLFDGLSGSDISALVSNLASASNVDEKKLVDAVFQAQKERASESEPLVEDNGVVVFPRTTK